MRQRVLSSLHDSPGASATFITGTRHAGVVERSAIPTGTESWSPESSVACSSVAVPATAPEYDLTVMVTPSLPTCSRRPSSGMAAARYSSSVIVTAVAELAPPSAETSGWTAPAVAAASSAASRFAAGRSTACSASVLPHTTVGSGAELEVAGSPDGERRREWHQ